MPGQESSPDATQKLPQLPPGSGSVSNPAQSGDGEAGPTVTFAAPTDTEVINIEGEANKVRDSRARLQTLEMKQLYIEVDEKGLDSVSFLDFIHAISKCKQLAAMVLPENIDASAIMTDEATFDAANDVFEAISAGTGRIDWASFKTYIKAVQAEDGKTSNDHLRNLFDVIDASKQGAFSRLQLLTAVRTDSRVCSSLVPGTNGADALDDEATFDAVNTLFDAMAGGKKRVPFADFCAYFRKAAGDSMAKILSAGSRVRSRAQKRIFIIGQGFGRMLNPVQTQVVVDAGYAVQFSPELPNPETPGFMMSQLLHHLRAAIDAFQPDCLLSASKGNAYVVALLSTGLWKGPTVLINVHPVLQSIPENVNVVVAHGSNDEVYSHSREYAEQVVATASENKRFLFWAGSSGRMQSGHMSRAGDMHNMASLLSYDTLPRLIDAAMSNESPELSFVRSWRGQLSDQRLGAESFLGNSLERLRRFRASHAKAGQDNKKLFEVPPGSEEFAQVLTMFHSAPRQPAAYCGTNYAAWERRPVVSIERVENGRQELGSSIPYRESVRKSINDQGLTFEPGVHTCWAFHGSNAIDSIVLNPIAGFQPLASGSRGSAVWGSGTYFARDAKYVAEGGFCPQRADGRFCMLLCLLSVGMPCLGDPAHNGVLPIRQGIHRYNSTVDSLASPEIFIIQHAGAAHPAYLITFE